MITEDYVSFEVAKLLKEKGFDCKKESITAMYGEDGEFYSLSSADPYYFNWDDFDENDYPAPTLQMTLKWLREKYYIYADPIKQGNYNDCSKYYTWIVAQMGIIYRNPSVIDKLSYEEAAETALKYALEKLI